MNKKIISLFGVLAIVLIVPQITLAIGPFRPGETLNPNCAPTTPNCTVSITRPSDTHVVKNIIERDSLVNLQAGDVVVVTDVNQTFIRTQDGTWQKFSKALLANIYLVTNIGARDALVDLQAGDVVVVTDINQTFARTQDGVWQVFSLSHLAENYVVPDLDALNTLTNTQSGDTAVVTSINKSYVRTQNNTWQELLSPSANLSIKNTYVVVDEKERDTLPNLQAGDIAVVKSTSTTYIYTQDGVWQQLLSSTINAVQAVNEKTGFVTLNSDDIPEGTNNKYWSKELSRSIFSAFGPISYDSSTGIFSLIKNAILSLLPQIGASTNGQFLTNDGLNISWASIPTQTQTPILDIPIVQLTSTKIITTKETLYTPISADMNINPGIGDFLISFSTSIQSDTNGNVISVSLFKNGEQIPSSEIFYSGKVKDFNPIYTSAYSVKNTGKDIFDVRWKVSSGVAIMYNRTFTTERVR